MLLMVFLLPSGWYEAEMAVAAFVFLAWCGAGHYRELVHYLRKPVIYLPLLMYLYIVAGFFFSEDRGAALSSLSVKLPWVIYPVLLIGGFDELLKRNVHRAFIAGLFSSLLIADVYAFADALFSGETHALVNEAIYYKWHSFGLTRLYHNNHPSYFALFANHALLILAFDSSEQLISRKRDRIFLIGFFILNIFLLGSIAGFMCMLYPLALTIRKSWRGGVLTRYRWVPLLAIFLVAGIVFATKNQKFHAILTEKLVYTDDPAQRNSLTIRMAKWKTYADIFTDHWLFGTTYGDIRSTRVEYYHRANFAYLEKMRYNAHNQFLETMGYLGLAGFLLFVLILLIPFGSRIHSSLYGWFLLLACTAFMTESILERQQGLNYFLFFYVWYGFANLRTARLAKTIPEQ